MTPEVLPVRDRRGRHGQPKGDAIERVGGSSPSRPRHAGYVDAMRAREAIMSTYLGNGIALPHGTSEAQGTSSAPAWP